MHTHTLTNTRTQAHRHTDPKYISARPLLPPTMQQDKWANQWLQLLPWVRRKSRLLSCPPHCIQASVFLNTPTHTDSRTAGMDQCEDLLDSADRGDFTYERSRWPHQASIWLPRQADQATKERSSNTSLSKRGWELQLGASPQARWVGQAGASKTWNMDELAGKNTIFGRRKFQTTFQKLFFYYYFLLPLWLDD